MDQLACTRALQEHLELIAPKNVIANMDLAVIMLPVSQRYFMIVYYSVIKNKFQENVNVFLVGLEKHAIRPVQMEHLVRIVAKIVPAKTEVLAEEMMVLADVHLGGLDTIVQNVRVYLNCL